MQAITFQILKPTSPKRQMRMKASSSSIVALKKGWSGCVDPKTKSDTTANRFTFRW